MALRTPLTVSPHMYIGDSTGRPLDNGMVYFGLPDQDPEFYPINIFSDDSLTIPVTQPVRTKGGYLNDNKGDMAEIHAKELIYSVKVLDQYGRKIFYKGQSMRSNWNDDVIIRINEAVAASQSIATNIANTAVEKIKLESQRQVSDAINNTAVEGGVLADTFVTATANAPGSVARNQRDKNNDNISVKDFGAKGDGVTDDTVAIFAAVKWINDKGGNANLVFPFGEYLIGHIKTNTIVSDNSWVSIVKTGSTETVFPFVNVSNVHVVSKGAKIKLRDSGITTHHAHGFSGATFTFYNSSRCSVRDVILDGNRAGQLHTVGTNTGHNHGVFIHDNCDNITIEGCVLENLGSLRLGVDKRGDGVYAANGATNIFVRKNIFRNMGRWAVVLEAGRGGTQNYVIEDNVYYGNDRNSADPYTKETLGFVDIESYRDHSDIVIKNNIIHTAGQIAFGGWSSTFLECLIHNITIEGNTWYCNNLVGADGYHDPISLTSANGTTNTLKKYKNLIIKGNKFYFGDEAKGVLNSNRILVAETGWFEDVFIRDNIIRQNNPSVSSESGLLLYRSKVTGVLEYSRNTIYANLGSKSWFGVSECRETTVIMLLQDNKVSASAVDVSCNARDLVSSVTVYDTNNDFGVVKTTTNTLPNAISTRVSRQARYNNINNGSGGTALNVVSTIAVNDALKPVFKVDSGVSPNAAISLDVTLYIQDIPKSTALLKFTAIKTSGVWNITGTTKELEVTKLGGFTWGKVALTIVDGAIVISVGKASGGADAKVVMVGTILAANCKLVNA